jgi:tRNA pseudouridine38-40 synthase
VQSELEGAARKVGWKGDGLMLAGRTDAGVHAVGQVAALDLNWRHSPDALRDALNARLPRDLVVLDAEPVEDQFHPRFGARSRLYRYEIHCASLRHPLKDLTSWRIWPPVDLDTLNGVAGLFVGQHDFGAFGTPARKGASTVRKLAKSRWASAPSGLRYEVVADGFLRRMVRRLVYVQVAVGQGRCSANLVWRTLREGDRGLGLPAGLAPPQGLTLMEVRYGTRRGGTNLL